MNMTMEDASVARRLRGTVNSSRNLLDVFVLASFSASRSTWMSAGVRVREQVFSTNLSVLDAQ